MAPKTIPYAFRHGVSVANKSIPRQTLALYVRPPGADPRLN